MWEILCRHFKSSKEINWLKQVGSFVVYMWIDEDLIQSQNNVSPPYFKRKISLESQLL